MDNDLLKLAIYQGLGHVLVCIRCPHCGYIPEEGKEELAMHFADTPCLHCNQMNPSPQLAPTNYLYVTNWVGEYAISDKSRDHVSAVILFCALTESLLETLKADYLKLHPEMEAKIKDKYSSIKDVFGKPLNELLTDAPAQIKQFTGEWELLRDKRNRFLHGKVSECNIQQTDADSALNLTTLAFRVYAWLNNKYCLSV